MDPRTNATRPGPRLGVTRAGAPTVVATECAQLRIRIVALENVVIALLAQAPEQQLALAREMATHISPRPGFTAHRLTLHAADEMRSLVVRARRFRTSPTARAVPGDEPT
jgi:hypothetical protein